MVRLAAFVGYFPLGIASNHYCSNMLVVVENHIAFGVAIRSIFLQNAKLITNHNMDSIFSLNGYKVVSMTIREKAYHLLQHFQHFTLYWF